MSSVAEASILVGMDRVCLYTRLYGRRREVEMIRIVDIVDALARGFTFCRIVDCRYGLHGRSNVAPGYTVTDLCWRYRNYFSSWAERDPYGQQDSHKEGSFCSQSIRIYQGACLCDKDVVARVSKCSKDRCKKKSLEKGNDMNGWKSRRVSQK
jgi:hypothetical protein